MNVALYKRVSVGERLVSGSCARGRTERGRVEKASKVRVVVLHHADDRGQGLGAGAVEGDV